MQVFNQPVWSVLRNFAGASLIVYYMISHTNIYTFHLAKTLETLYLIQWFKK